MTINVEIAQECNRWDTIGYIDKNLITDITQHVISRYKNLTLIQEIELSILLTNDTKMQSLNKEFRNFNKPTNVLSFKSLGISWQKILEFKTNHNYIYLGDVAFGYEMIERESQHKNIKFIDHFRHLLVHGLLHLIGYEHNSKQDAEAMESLEIEILKYYNIKSPY